MFDHCRDRLRRAITWGQASDINRIFETDLKESRAANNTLLSSPSVSMLDAPSQWFFATSGCDMSNSGTRRN